MLAWFFKQPIGCSFGDRSIPTLFSMRRRSKPTAPLLLQFCLLCLSVLFFNGCNNTSLADLNGTLLDPAMDLEDFRFHTADGDLNVSNFKGKHVILAFGYTYCPDACPTTMARLAQTVKHLAQNANQVQVMLVTVDPARDSLEKLNSYAKTFDPGFIGAAVAKTDSAAFFKTLGIFHERADSTATEDYLIDHTTSTIVLDQNGNWRMVA